MAGEARGTGCGHDGRYVWSSSRSLTNEKVHDQDGETTINCNEGEHIAVYGNQPTGALGRENIRSSLLTPHSSLVITLSSMTH